jgi:cyclopropane fatty-acyl-phospholipid synthase-like methyltransferase
VDREQVFDEDYLYFYEPFLSDEATAAQVELVWRLLELEPGMHVLDLACGHGRIANRLAERGARVTGLDATPMFLDRARADAAARGVEVEYVEGDMRDLPWVERFDRVISWFTSFGYFDDEGNRRVLREAHGALKPGGELLIENNNLAQLLTRALPWIVNERNGDFLIDRWHFDPSTSGGVTERIVIRDGQTRRFDFSVRMFIAAELGDWCRQAGFDAVEFYDNEGTPLTAESRRMITIARR